MTRDCPSQESEAQEDGPRPQAGWQSWHFDTKELSHSNNLGMGLQFCFKAVERGAQIPKGFVEDRDTPIGSLGQFSVVKHSNQFKSHVLHINIVQLGLNRVTLRLKTMK